MSPGTGLAARPALRLAVTYMPTSAHGSLAERVRVRTHCPGLGFLSLTGWGAVQPRMLNVGPGV